MLLSGFKRSPSLCPLLTPSVLLWFCVALVLLPPSAEIVRGGTKVGLVIVVVLEAPGGPFMLEWWPTRGLFEGRSPNKRELWLKQGRFSSLYSVAIA